MLSENCYRRLECNGIRYIRCCFGCRAWAKFSPRSFCFFHLLLPRDCILKGLRTHVCSLMNTSAIRVGILRLQELSKMFKRVQPIRSHEFTL